MVPYYSTCPFCLQSGCKRGRFPTFSRESCEEPIEEEEDEEDCDDETLDAKA